MDAVPPETQAQQQPEPLLLPPPPVISARVPLPKEPAFQGPLRIKVSSAQVPYLIVEAEEGSTTQFYVNSGVVGSRADFAEYMSAEPETVGAHPSFPSKKTFALMASSLLSHFSIICRSPLSSPVTL